MPAVSVCHLRHTAGLGAGPLITLVLQTRTLRLGAVSVSSKLRRDLALRWFQPWQPALLPSCRLVWLRRTELELERGQVAQAPGFAARRGWAYTGVWGLWLGPLPSLGGYSQCLSPHGDSGSRALFGGAQWGPPPWGRELS